MTNDLAEREGGAVVDNSFSGGPVWEWFSLSYSAYLVVPRTLLCGMPREWQEQFVALMERAEAVYDTDKIADNYTVNLRGDRGRFVPDPLGPYRHFNPNDLPYRQANSARSGDDD